MTVKISGVLKDGTGKPVQNCTIVLVLKPVASLLRAFFIGGKV